MKQLQAYAKRKLEALAYTEVSSRPLALIRIFVMLIMYYKFAGPLVGYRMLTYQTLPELAPMLLMWVMWVSVSLVFVGYKTRWAGVILVISFGILHLYYGAYLGNPRLAKPVQAFQLSVLLTLTPSGRSLSVDRVIEVRRAKAEGREPEPESMPWWQLELIIFQLVAVYLWAAQNKSDAKWFRGERMERYYLEWYGGSDSFVYSPIIHPISVIMAWATTILEYALVIGLLSRRFRHYFLWGGILLHVGILFMFSVPFFSMMMMTALIACARPDKVHEFIALQGGGGARGRGPPESSSPRE